MIFKQIGYNYCFDSDKCATCKGNCCIGESGYIWISPDESLKIANFLGLEFSQFVDEYLIKVGFKFSIKEKPFKDGFACMFFDEEKLQCKIYDLRPNQCKTFPFWEYFKTHIKEAERECPGIIL